MGRNWSRQRDREAMARTRAAQIDQARYLGDLEAPEVQPSKAELVAEARDAIARYTGPVRRLPTVIRLKCYRCNHQGKAHVQPGQRRRFKCSRCGATSL